MRVLIVENDIIIAMHLAMLVAEFGHEVVATVRSASEAVTQAIALAPDVALMDIRLDGGGGVDVARELHERQALRCIFVSANLDEPTRAALLPYDPLEFVGKPVVPVVLQRALGKAQDMTEL
jgi:DNA-binding NarL/FixJ family response regulator